MPDLLDQQLAAIKREFSKPDKITDFLKRELDKAVAARSCDAERLRLLAIEHGNWALRFREFCHDGKHPFGGPPPGYEPMQAADFHVVLGMISSAQAVIKERMARRVDA